MKALGNSPQMDRVVMQITAGLLLGFRQLFGLVWLPAFDAEVMGDDAGAYLGMRL